MSAPQLVWARPGAPCPRGLMALTGLARVSMASAPPRVQGPGARVDQAARGRLSVTRVRAVC